MTGPSTEIGPGWWAFVAFFFLAVALWLLMRSMFTRLRRMRLADEQRQREQPADGDAGQRAPGDGPGSAGEPDRRGEGERGRGEV